MPENFYSPQGEPQSSYGTARQESLSHYTAKTFGTMFLGLLVTFVVAWLLAYPGQDVLVNTLINAPWVQLVVLVAQLVVVLAMSAMIKKLSPAAAAACFLVYSVLTGLTFSLFFVAYEVPTLALVFGFTALYFGGMAIFGYLTRIDLSRLRTVLVGGLIAIIIFNLLMLFIPGLQVADRIMCTLGVILFLAFTAYDTQKIKAYYYGFQGDDAMLKKASIISALELYLDFINLFLYLLRLFGKSKD